MNSGEPMRGLAGWLARDRLVLCALAMLVALVYAVVFPGSFFADDLVIIKGNSLVRDFDLAGILSSDYWGNGAHSGLYRPLTVLSFAINRAILGPAPWGYLLVNLLLHAGVCGLLFLLLVRLGLARPPAFFAAALFAVHPGHGEAVAELVGRAELLAAGFVIVSMLLLQVRSRVATGAAMVSFAAALLCKEHTVVLLAIVPLVDLFFEGSALALARRRWPVWCGLLLVAVSWFIWRRYGVRVEFGPPMVLDPYFVPLGGLDHSARVLAALQLQGLYLARMFIPVGLLGAYPASVVLPVPGWGSLEGAAIIAALVGTMALLIYGWRRRAFWALALLLYAVSFLPTSQLFFAAEFTMADRLSYLPSLWFCTMLASLLWRAARSDRLRRHVYMAAVVMLCGYAGAGVARAFDFRSPEHLWQSDLRIKPDNELALLMLGDYYRGQGRLTEAATSLQRLVEIAPGFEQGLSVYAGVLVELGRPDEAIMIARKASVLMRGGRSLAQLPMAAAYNMLGRPVDALTALGKVPPESAQLSAYWEVYGRALELNGDFFGALQAYNREMQSAGGGRRDVFRRIGRLYLQLGDHSRAEAALREAVTRDPQQAEGWNLLGVSLGQQGKQEAVEAFRRAVELRPEVKEYQANLARESLRP